FRGPIAGAAGAVFLAGEDDERDAGALVFDGGIVDRHDRAFGLMLGYAALGAGGHEVLDADVGEGAAGHDAVVAAAGAVAVEVLVFDAVLREILAGGRGFLDGAGGGDVVGGDAITEDAERARALDFVDVAGFHAEGGEERGLLD